MTRARPLRERDIEKYLVKMAKLYGGEIRKIKWIGRNGAPDRVLMMPQRVVGQRSAQLMSGKRHVWIKKAPAMTCWVEVKAPGVPPEDHQLREHKRMRDVGQRVEVVDSFESVDALFR
jgi:hypothetical protein